MKPYPTTKEGLIISPFEIGFQQPTEAQIAIRGLCNVHHGYWPHRRLNQDPITRTFKNAKVNTFIMFAYEHNYGQDTLHTKFKPSRMPKPSVMVDFLDEIVETHGFIESIKQDKTHETYQVTSDQWETIRGGHGIQEIYRPGALQDSI